ncbi:hypothetical protein RsTz2092_07380 [Deferribacterales bacterium RsTz2092]|nr:hypothetical protein AGMMS49941_07330 [Deferribacterales bacterium]
MLKDKGLDDLLKQCSNDDLEPLVGYILKKSTEGLSAKPEYKMHHPNHKKYVKEIVDEIQLFGGNTIANLYRGHGVPYAEIVSDVASKLGVKTNSDMYVEDLEREIQVKMLENMYKEMNDEQKEALLKEANYSYFGSIPKALPIVAIQAAMRGVMLVKGGFFPYKTAVTVANVMSRAVSGHGLAFATNPALTRGISFFLGRIGWAITGALTVWQIASSAYSVTIPCVAHIAYLRQKQKTEIK